MEDITRSEDVERVRLQRCALEGALTDAEDFEPLWCAIHEYMAASGRRESLEDADEYSALLPIAAIVESNAKFCVAASVDLHASRVLFAAQKALMDLDRKEA